MVGVLAVPAQAIERIETRQTSCAAVQAALQAEGAAILRYPSARSSQILYDRYVANRTACLLGQVTRRASVPTADRRACPVKRCVWAEPREDRRPLRQR
ncbi:hypothetical protein KY465_16090 [Pseudohoeflea sp. DP4N28-3]|uniref:Uncharacterized protein n=1 Tax=Pseudohoeflea coraliihabitans TaxID=2860393 RepID=A0ABS6WUS4_9HYPH|nr:hypothetical protein [Pseudohoeflea sp. DP4N28-3]